jgi:Haemolysin-type calcium binding protein related domain
MIGVNPTGETIKTAYQFYSQTANRGIKKFQFADSSSWDFQTINANAWIGGTSGSDSISLPVDGATVDAGLGDDTLSVSGNGSDRIIFAKGDGHDTLTNPGSGYNRNDRLELTDINSSEVQFSRAGDSPAKRSVHRGYVQSQLPVLR